MNKLNIWLSVLQKEAVSTQNKINMKISFPYFRKLLYFEFQNNKTTKL